MRVLVTGGRDFADRTAMARELEACALRSRGGCLRIIQGGASGADALAREWCARNFVPYENYPAEWGKHGKAAGPIRNARMIAEGKPDLVVAFPRANGEWGPGTEDCIRQAKAFSVPVVRVAGSEPLRTVHEGE